MCLDCGCNMPKDDMGDPERHITVEDLGKALTANPGMSGDELLQNMKDGLNMISGKDVEEEAAKQKSKS